MITNYHSQIVKIKIKVNPIYTINNLVDSTNSNKTSPVPKNFIRCCK